MVLALMLSLSEAHAGEVVQNAVARELVEFNLAMGPLKPDERIHFARSISAVCKAYRNVIPTITPDEHAWLQKEMGQESSGERMIAAAGTTNLARYKSAQFLDECLDITDKIIETSDIPIRWAFLAQLLTDEDIADHLSGIGTLTPDSTDVTGARFMLGADTASTIIGRILVPALLRTQQ